MCAKMRSVLERISPVFCSVLVRVSPVFWLADITMATIHLADRNLHFLGFIIIGTGLGASGLTCGAITATASHDRALLLAALVANRPPQAGASADHAEGAQAAPDHLRVV